MNNRHLKRFFFALGGIAFLFAGMAALPLSGKAETTFYGTPPVGLLELPEYRYPVYLYVPQNYKPDRKYALVISIPEEGQSPEKHVQYWMEPAKRRSMFILAVTNLRPEDLPGTTDQWLLGIKEDVMKRYRIDADRVFLTGEGSGAHYASYLGVNYPREFSAAVLFNEAWPGRFQRLLRLSRRPVNQIPFLIVAPSGDTRQLELIEQKALRLEGRGYPITLMNVDNAEQVETGAFKRDLVDWLEHHSAAWKRVIQESQKSLKEKTISWFENLFRVT